MSVCPALSELCFYGYCHSCYMLYHLFANIKNYAELETHQVCHYLVASNNKPYTHINPVKKEAFCECVISMVSKSVHRQTS